MEWSCQSGRGRGASRLSLAAATTRTDAEVQVAGALLSMVDTWHVAHVANVNTPDTRHGKAEVRVSENMTTFEDMLH